MNCAYCNQKKVKGKPRYAWGSEVFCSSRCADRFGHAAYKAGYRMIPKEAKVN